MSLKGPAGLGASASVGIGTSASAGVSASGGAFAGLRTSKKASASLSLDTHKLVPKAPSVSVATGAGAGFSIGGQAKVQGSASLSADVGAEASLRSRIQFEDEEL